MAHRVSTEESPCIRLVVTRPEKDKSGRIDPPPAPSGGLGQLGNFRERLHFAAGQRAVGADPRREPVQIACGNSRHAVTKLVADNSRCGAVGIGDRGFQAAGALERTEVTVQIGAVDFPRLGSVDGDADLQKFNLRIVDRRRRRRRAVRRAGGDGLPARFEPAAESVIDGGPIVARVCAVALGDFDEAAERVPAQGLGRAARPGAADHVAIAVVGVGDVARKARARPGNGKRAAGGRGKLSAGVNGIREQGMTARREVQIHRPGADGIGRAGMGRPALGLIVHHDFDAVGPEGDPRHGHGLSAGADSVLSYPAEGIDLGGFRLPGRGGAGAHFGVGADAELGRAPIEGIGDRGRLAHGGRKAFRQELSTRIIGVGAGFVPCARTGARGTVAGEGAVGAPEHHFNQGRRAGNGVGLLEHAAGGVAGVHRERAERIAPAGQQAVARKGKAVALAVAGDLGHFPVGAVLIGEECSRESRAGLVQRRSAAGGIPGLDDRGVGLTAGGHGLGEQLAVAVEGAGDRGGGARRIGDRVLDGGAKRGLAVFC